MTAIPETFAACEVGDTRAVQQHVASGLCDIDGNTRFGHIDTRGWRRSPLHVAIQFGHLDLARWLLEHGADPNVRTTFGDTPLNALLAPPLPAHYLEAVRLLMAHGADPTLPNEEDETPLTHAQRTQATWAAVGPLLSQTASRNRTPIDPAGRFSIVQVANGVADAYYLTVMPPGELPESGLTGITIVGVLKSLPDAFNAIDPAAFRPNERFIELLHDVIGRRGPDQAALQREAQRLGTGHVFVIDQRTATPAGPVPPEDILGYFAVSDGAVLPDSYRSNPNYRLVTQRGLFQLHPELHAALVAELISRA